MTHLWEYPEFQRFGWTLLHSLWQGALVFVVAAALLHVLRDKSTQIRYVVACTALGIMVVLAAGTYASLTNRADTIHVGLTAAPIKVITHTSGDAWLAGVIRWLPLAWMLGVLFFSVRLFGGWYWLFRDIRRGSVSAPSEWQWRLVSMARLLGITRKVCLFVSDRATTPLAAGWFKPLVLLPASALTRLSPEALEAVLAHELAHIRRHDYIVNLLQSIVEVLFFYHPATWWLSGQIRELREHCCDDAAVKLCGSPVSYAGALASLETLRAEAAPPQLATAANGASLMKRIQRLLNVSQPDTHGLRAGFMAVVMVLVAGASVLWGFNADNQARQENQKIVIRDGDSSLRANMKDEDNSKIISYSNKFPRVIIGMQRDGTEFEWDGWNGSIPFDREEFRKNMEELKINLKTLQIPTKEEIEKIVANAKDVSINTEELKKLATELGKNVFVFSDEEGKKILGDSLKGLSINSEELKKRVTEIKENVKDIKIIVNGESLDMNDLNDNIFLIDSPNGPFRLSPRIKDQERRKEDIEKEMERLTKRMERLQKELEKTRYRL